MKYEKNVLSENRINDILKRDGKITFIITKEELKDENIEFFGICSESDYNDIYYVYID